jgi:hypothetical protein
MRDAVRALRLAIRELLWREQAEERAARLAPAQRGSVRLCVDAARRRVNVAQEFQRSDTIVALVLYVQAARLYAMAFLVSTDENLDVGALSPGSVFDELERAIKAGPIAAPKRIVEHRDLLSTSDPLALDRLSAADASSLADELESMTRWLSSLVEAREPREIRRARALRMTATVLALLLLVSGVVYRALAPANLALDSPVRASSVAYQTAAAGAVDGEKNGRFGFHSQEEDSPSLVIDLRRPSRITLVKVFGRGDCCHDQSIPITLEVSDDGTSFRSIADRTTEFSEADPWLIKPDSLVTRYVRLRSTRRTVLVLSEVEVYGYPKR